MNANPKLPEICKDAFTKAREKLGLSTKDLGGMACLSTRQIEQIENGQMGAFYGVQIKLTAAKKVAKILGLSDEEAFEYAASTLVQSESQKDEEIQPEVTELPKVETVQVARKLPASVIPEEKKVLIDQLDLKQSTSELNTSNPKSTPSKKILIWLAVILAVAYATFSLQPLFFSEQPEEIVVVKEEIIEPAPVTTPAEPTPVAPAAVVPAVAVPAPSAEASTACPAEEGIISYKPDAPRKAADMVYVQVKTKQVICVSDASGKIQSKMVEPGVGASFYGKPPFKVLTGGLAQADVFFQGAKVRLTNPNYKTLILEAAEVVAPPVDRTDSQQR